MGSALRIMVMLLVAAACAPPAEACSCVSSGPPCQNFFQSEAVFVGTVTGIRPLQVDSSDRPTFDRRVVAFKVENGVRGVQGATVEVRTGNGDADCGFNFKTGERYVVYAYKHQDGSLGTGICSRTRLAADAAEDLAYFGALPATGTGARLYGTVKHWEHDYATQQTVQYGGVADVQVLVRGSSGSFSAMTDTTGSYNISGIRPGSYQVEFLPPAGFSTGGHQSKVEFTDARACRVADFSLHYDGRIRGRLVDATGQPVAGVRLDLVSAANPQSTLFFVPTRVSDDAGRFEIAAVPPGLYLLAVGFKPRYDDEKMYPATFYPGSSRVEEARQIAVGPAEHVQLDPLRLPSALAQRTLIGTVVMPDGTPVSGATVVLRTGNTQASTVATTNDLGEFSLRAFEGVTYTVQAFYNVPGEPRRPQLQARHNVRITASPEPVRLVLTPLR
jgi:hypothetical protein